MIFTSCGDTKPAEEVVVIDTLALKIDSLSTWLENVRGDVQSKYDSIEYVLLNADKLESSNADFSHWNDTNLFGSYLYWDWIFDPQGDEMRDFRGGYEHERLEVNGLLTDSTYLIGDLYRDSLSLYSRMQDAKKRCEKYMQLRYFLVISTKEYNKGAAGGSTFYPATFTGRFVFIDLSSNSILHSGWIEATNSDEIGVTSDLYSGRNDASARLRDDLEFNILKKCEAAILREQKKRLE